MNIVNDYFNFKKNYLLEYASILLKDMSLYERDILNIFIKVYINSYYFNEFETITYDKEYITLKEVREELKGKELELIYNLNSENKEKEETIKKIYKVTNLICAIDLKKYEDANIIGDYSIILEDIFYKNGKGVLYSTKEIDAIARLVKKNRNKTIKYLDNAKSDTFYIKTVVYRGFSDRYITKMLYNIPTLSNYKENVVDNIYNNKGIYLEKLVVKLKLLNAIILEKIIKRDKCGLYFVKIPTEYINKDDMKKILEITNNKISKKHLVFIMEYNLYKNKPHTFSKEDGIKYAALVNFKKVRDLNIKLTELENNKLFSYIVIDGVNTEDRKTILNYDMNGKEIFENIYDFNDSED